MSNKQNEKKDLNVNLASEVDNKFDENIDITKFKFIKREEELHDEALQTKPIGYYKDAWIRFKKNKASVVAAILIAILLFFTVFGPYMKVYTVPDRSMTEAHRLRELPPRIPGLEKLGIFDGSKVIRRSQEHVDKIPPHIIKEVVESDGNQIYVNVFYYEYLSYYNSLPENSQTLTLSQYERALANNAIIELLDVTANGLYVTQVDYFRYSMQQNASDTYFWFGTDMSGRDLFTMLWEGARISIFLAIAVTMINLVVGLILGAIAGYYGGLFDLLFDRIVDILGNIPFLGILSFFVIRYGSTIFVVIIAFTITGWLGSYRSTRAQYYRFKHREYVLAARSLGAADGRVMFKHIFPNAIGTLITAFALSIPLFIFTESTFSFLGIINYAETTSIGRLLSLGQSHMQQHYHLLLFPAIFLSILMLSFNLFGNGLRDAFNPSLRGVDE